MLINLLMRIVTAKYTVPSWLWVSFSIAGGFLVGLHALYGYGNVDAFVEALPLNGQLWGPMVVLAGLVVMFGMGLDNYTYVRVGSFVSWMMWLLAMLSFATNHDLLGFIIGIPMLLFWTYKYLASYIRQKFL